MFYREAYFYIEKLAKNLDIRDNKTKDKESQKRYRGDRNGKDNSNY